MGPILSVVVTAHNESILLGQTLQSAERAIAQVESTGGTVERVLGVDSADRATQSFIREYSGEKWRIHEVNHQDSGLTRNELVSISSGQYIAFLDGDDLFSENWLKKSLEVVRNASNIKTIYHPELNWVFDQENHVWVKSGMSFEFFSPYHFYFGNHYDTLNFTLRQCFIENPFAAKSAGVKYGYEDWTWNMDTIANGWRHEIVEDTIIFKRRRLNSVSHKENTMNAIPRRTKLHLVTEMSRFNNSLR